MSDLTPREDVVALATDFPTLDLSGEKTSVRRFVSDLWAHRSLLFVLAHRDFSARYRSAQLGVAWSALLPLLQGAVLAVLFTRVVSVPLGDHQVVFILAGMVTWSFFNGAVAPSSTSLVDGSQVTTKIYFPRSFLPAATTATTLPGFGVSLAVVFAVLLVTGPPVTVGLLLLVPAVALTVALAFVVGALAAISHVYFRDARYLLQASLIVWFYATPIFYPISAARWLRWIVLANPMTGPVQLVRRAMLGHADYLGPSLAVSVGFVTVVGVAVVVIYARFDRVVVDRL